MPIFSTEKIKNINRQKVRYGSIHLAVWFDNLHIVIKSFNPNISDYDALALAKGGVIKDLNSVELSVNYAHKKGTAGTKCN